MILFVGHPSHWEVWRATSRIRCAPANPPQKALRHVVFDYLDTNTELTTVCNNAVTATAQRPWTRWSLPTTTSTLSAPWMSAEATASYRPHPHAEVDHS